MTGAPGREEHGSSSTVDRLNRDEVARMEPETKNLVMR